MPITITWDDEAKTMFRYTFEGQWTWDDVYATMQKANTMLPENPVRIDVLIDYQSTARIPDSFITNLKGIAKRQPDFAGITVIIAKSAIIKVFVDVSRRTDAKIADKIYWVETDEQAYQLIEQDRKSDEQVPTDEV